MLVKKARVGDVLTIVDPDGNTSTVRIVKTTDDRVTLGIVAPDKLVSLVEFRKDVARLKSAIDNSRFRV